MPGRYSYHPDEWRKLLDEHELTADDVAKHCNFSSRHVYDILNGATPRGHLKSIKKIRVGLGGNGIPTVSIERLFSKRF